jgi:TonB-linked SusC/RagA family outer membrane protein
MKKYDWLDNLKLRASFGMAGNDNNSQINNYQYLNGYSKSGNYVFGANQTVVDGLASRGLSNPDITWEKTTTYNFGVDFSLWRSKLYGNVDVFYRKVSDVFGDQTQSLPNTFGATLPQLNINSFNDRGIEVTLGHIGKTKDLRYSIEGNIAWTRSKWGHYDEPVYKDENERERLQKSGQWRNRWFGYRSAGIFRSQEEINAWKVDQDGQGNKTLAPGDIKYLDLNNDGVLSDRDQTVIGRSDVPELTFGLKTSLQWRGFDFNMLWQGAGLVNTEYTLHLRRPFFDSATPTVGFLKRFDAVDNPNGSWPRMTFDNSSNNDKESDFWLQNATYIRLKNIELGYTLPKNILNKINLSSLRFFISATNLLTIDNVDTIDPEVGAGDRGWRYPTQKTVSFGFNLNF